MKKSNNFVSYIYDVQIFLRQRTLQSQEQQRLHVT